MSADRNGDSPLSGADAGPHAALLDLQEQLDSARKAQKQMKKKLASSEQQVKALGDEMGRILSSSSWRITAPLRRLRVWMGAPEPAVAEVISAPSDEQESHAVEQSLLPLPLPKGVLASKPARMVASNETCVILRPEVMLEGMVHRPDPDVLQPPDASSVADDGPDGVGKFRIAFIGSEELAAELAHDVELVPLLKEEWAHQIASRRFDLLLVEPVWHVGGREWRNTLTRHGRDGELVARLFAEARACGLPSAIWYRCDEADAEHFAWLAGFADAAYAIDRALADNLSRTTGRQLGVLAPAIQPALHNPFRSWPQLDAQQWRSRVLYDGWLELADGAATDPFIRQFKEDSLLVAESTWEFGGVRLKDHPEFLPNAIGCLTLEGKAALTKMVGAEIFRPSMLVPQWKQALMKLRAIASGALVAEEGSSHAQWGGLPLRGEPDAVARHLRGLMADPLQRARFSHGALREVLGRHCLVDRLDQIAADLGLPIRFGRRPARVACLLVTMRPDLLPACLDRFRADRYPHKELVVVMHGRDASLEQARALVREGEPITIFQLGRELSLGSCLNFAAAQSDAEYWAKIDDDDIYGPNYLSDVMMYRKAVDFPVAGKTAAFVYAEADDEIRFDPAYASARSWQYRRAGRGERIHIAGGTLVGKREVLADVPFSDVRRKGSDTDFLRRADAAGFDFCALDFFNFALFRSGTPGFHTWNADLDDMKQRTLAVGKAADIGEVVCI